MRSEDRMAPKEGVWATISTILNQKWMCHMSTWPNIEEMSRAGGD
jgi:hypothetical protein